MERYPVSCDTHLQQDQLLLVATFTEIMPDDKYTTAGESKKYRPTSAELKQFDFKPRYVRSLNSFYERVNEFVMYKNKYGTTAVPQSHGDLGRW